MPSFLPFPSVIRTRQHVNLGRNPRSLAKTRLPRLVTTPQVTISEAATQGYSTVAPPIAFNHSGAPSIQHATVNNNTFVMRVHTCRHCGEVFPSYPDLRQHLDSHVQPPIGHTCTTCKKSFTRREYLLKHSSRCRPKPFVCTVCDSSFGRKDNLDRHKITVQCGSPPQPGPSAPKRRRIALNEDPLFPPPVEQLDDELSSDLQDAVRDNWGSIRTYVVQGPVQTRYNHRLTTMDTRELQEPLRQLFEEQTTDFKVNLSFGFILKQKVTGRLRYYHSSNNCCGRLLEEPSLITNRGDFDRFLARIQESDILQWAIAQRPNSDWVCEHVTNATFFLNKIIHHPIGCVGVTLPDYLKHNKAIVGLEKDHHRNATYNDNLCLFRCLALHQGCDVRRLETTVVTLYAKYTDTLVHDFAGVTIDDLSKIEATFGVNVVVYKLVPTGNEKTKAEIVWRSLCSYAQTMYLNLYEAHFSYIKDIRMYSHSYKCSKCEQALWKTPYDLHRHERTCEAGVNRKYKGGVYHPPPSVFERLDDEGIVVEKMLRYYPYRATFDFESYFSDERLPANSDKLQWSARHIPLSVSVASNVPGHEAPCCFITDGDSDKLVADMMRHLHTISDAAYESLSVSYADVLDQLKARKESWDDAESEANTEEEENEKESKTNPFNTLAGQLLGWLRQLPVVGFNSGKYDLNVVKKFFIPYLMKPSEDDEIDETRFVIKRQNTFMCFSTNKLKFLDMVNFLAPGYSYDKYLTAYGCMQQKGHFPYEYMDGIGKLEDRALPPQAAFYSRLKNEGISDEDYARCQAVWHDNKMETLRDYLIFYNNLDVTPFLEAISKQFTFYRDRGIDMFKDGISVPGLSLLYLFNNLPPKTFFTVFNQTNSDLHKLVKDNIVGGPAIIFHRYHEKDVTKIRGGGETCRSIVGYDANALYLWAIMQDMPTGWYTRRREENKFRPQQAQSYGQMAIQWLTRESDRTGCTIRHQGNGREKRIGKLPVDGWCAETRTAYQFHGCFWHGCPKCHTDPEETNPKNNKTMATLLADTKKHTTYLRRHVKVVEMWECDWKRERDPPPRQKWKMTQQQIITAVVDGTLFGMVECDVRVPEHLQDHFAEMQPIFKNTTVTRDDIGPFMRQYAEEHDIMSTPRRMLVGSFHGIKLLLATPLLRWYLAHGLVVDRVYQIVDYEPNPCFQRFGESVSAARRAGDADPEKAIIADTMKLLGNSAYGKTVTNIDKHRDVRYSTEVGTSSHINNKRFRQLDVVTEDAYEITSNKVRLTYDLPLHIGFFVYQYAKLRMLQFYYDFIDRYVDRSLFQYCEMDTDSAYIALAGDSIDDLVSAEHREHYFKHRSEWLPAECCDEHKEEYVNTRLAERTWTATEPCCIARKAFDKRTPGLFKIEWCGDGFIGLCSKTYYCFGSTDKCTTKGLNKRQNTIDKDAFLSVLTNRRSDSGVNRGFRVRDSSVMTYIQERAALTYFYPKRKVLEDGLTTAPLDL